MLWPGNDKWFKSWLKEENGVARSEKRKVDEKQVMPAFLPMPKYHSNSFLLLILVRFNSPQNTQILSAHPYDILYCMSCFNYHLYKSIEWLVPYVPFKSKV